MDESLHASVYVIDLSRTFVNAKKIRYTVIDVTVEKSEEEHSRHGQDDMIISDIA